MPKESRRSGSRGSNRQRSCEDSDDGKKSSLRDTPKIGGSNVNRFAPFQRDIPRRESRSGEEETFTALVRSKAKSGGIIENGMKYIMFPLHLLRFCIFGTTTLPIDEDGKSKDRKEIEPSEEKREKEIRGKKDEVPDLRENEENTDNKVGNRSSDDSKKLLKDKKKSCDEKNHSEERRTSRDRRDSSDRDDRDDKRGIRKEENRPSESRKSFGSRVVDDDSDSSSSDKWSTAESSMDVSFEYESTYESVSTSCRLEEPMDISIEESIDENSLNASRITSNRTGTARVGSASSWRREVEDSSSTSSIEEEISRVFQRKCTSSSSDDDDSVPSVSHRDKKRDDSDRRDRKDREDVASRESIPESKVKSERGVVKSNTRRKEESLREKTVERRTTSGTTSSGHNSSPRRVSRTPVKSKDTRKRYKEKGVQTDSAFSDDDVEMIPLDARYNEKRTSNRAYRRKPLSASYQMEGMDQDILYIADNEDSNDGCGRYSWNRISPVSESSSSTDLGFEDQRCLSRNYRTHVKERERVRNPLRDDTTIKDLSKRMPLPRAPPGFPQVPQNPPISLKSWNDQGSLDFSLPTEKNLPISQYGQNYPPAPTPMKHLYHEYQAFMPFPEEIRSLKIFKTIPANGYLC